MAQQTSASRTYEQRKAAIEQMDAIEMAAAASVAQTDMIHGAGISVYNSFDRSMQHAPNDMPSFARVNESKNQGRKWRTGVIDADDDFQAHVQDNVSEHDATAANVKRNNLVQMFLRGTEVDEYIIKNLYGKERYIRNDDPNMTMGEITMLEGLNLDETFTHQIQTIHRKSLIGKGYKQGDVSKPSSVGLSAFQTYVALVKGYCALLILVLPKAFTHGGYAFSPFCIFVSGFVQYVAANKLVQVGQSVGLKSYSLIMLKVLGKRSKVVLDFMIAATQFSFTISFCAFMTETWVSLLKTLFGLEVGPWTPGVVLLVILTLMAWIRDISKFASTMLVGNLCILTTIIIVSCVMTKKLINNNFTPADGIIPINYKGMWTMVGFSCYTFEGIGVVMPIMHACSCPEKFPRLLLYAIGSLIILYSIFGNLVYYTLGNKITHTFVTQEIDQKSIIVIVLNLLYCTNTMCSYAIFIFPANNIIEEYSLHCITRRINNRTEMGRKYKKLRYMLQNLSRFIIVLLAIYFAIELQKQLDKFLSVLGALLCAPLAILFPALLHLAQLAKTRQQIIIDLLLIILASFVMLFSTVQSVSNW